MSPVADFISKLSGIFQEPVSPESDQQLIELLEARGFVFAARSTANLRLLAEIFPQETLIAITVQSLSASLPDMAINGLERVAAVVSHDHLRAVCSVKSRLNQLLNICGASPFLTNTLCRDPSYFENLFIGKRIDRPRQPGELLATLKGMVGDSADYPALLPLLRRFKYAEVLRIAGRDLSGLAPLEEVTLELTQLAEATLSVAHDVARRSLVVEHGEPLMETAQGKVSAELTILGMGKFGGQELNFSSDIDIICLYSSDSGETEGVDDGNGGRSGVISLHAFFVRLSEMIAKAISHVTDDGFVFRVDLGLRPEGKGGDLAISLRSAEVYYELWGQSWERSAMLKARPVAGSLELGEKFLNAIEPFIYRKYLDYNLIEDMMGMKKKIDASLAREREGEYNIKLGRGGIREIEFFIQALQLVYAGKNKALRERNSLKALDVLRNARIIRDDDHHDLCEAYRFLRTVEHRIQVVQERQTHSLPRKDDEYAALARRCGFLRSNGVERFRQTLESHRGNVSAIYGGLFLERDQKLHEEVSSEVYTFFDHRADSDLIKDMLAERRFESVDAAYNNLLILRDGPVRANLTERARRILEKIAPLLLQEIFASPDPDMALSNLERFLSSVGSRSTFYALLAENRQVLKLLVSLFGVSEFLSKIFIGHPEILDSMVAKTYASALKEPDFMKEELTSLLDKAVDLEERLDIIRRYRHEEFLRIGMNDIYGKFGQTEIATQLTSLAEVCLAAAFDLAQKELTRFGNPQYTDVNGTCAPASFAVLAMGKMGGRELNYHSDLDIIYIYDHQGYTDGEKQISNHEYFAKLGQKIIMILTTQTREGYVYKIDTRLRPSGNAGPLVTSLESFRDYHRRESQVWERQALTKSRVVLGDELLADSIDEVVRQSVYGSGIEGSVRQEIHRLRMRMENEIAREREGNYNIKTGRGGMVDVEFIVQYLQLGHGHTIPEIRNTNTLVSLKALRASGVLSPEDGESLIDGYKFLRRLENRLRIIHDYSMNDLGGSKNYLNKLALRLGYDPKLKNPGEVLMKEYEHVTDTVREVYARILGDE
jgi:glutamate-ammonia-ligase adenylyltransferase